LSSSTSSLAGTVTSSEAIRRLTDHSHSYKFQLVIDLIFLNIPFHLLFSIASIGLVVAAPLKFEKNNF